MRKILRLPREFLINTLPAIARSNPPERKPPTMGTPVPIAYFAALRVMPSYVAEVSPCTVKKMPNTETQTPMIHLLILLKKAEKLFSFNSLDRFPATENAMMVSVSGKTTAETTETMVVLKKATAG